MSDSRKILVAKRGGCERNRKNEQLNFKKGCNDPRQGLKRPLPSTPTKNLANERLKRLRTSLQAEAQKNNNRPNKVIPKKPVSTVSNVRKRPPDVDSSSGIFQTKVPRNNEPGVSILLKSPRQRQSVNESTSTSDIVTIQQYSCDQTAKIVTSSDIEAMEWAPADSTNIESTNESIKIFDSTCSSNASSNSSDFFIVVDTNIFISQMQMIRNIIEMNVEGSKKPVIFIPWIVIEELDFIKEDSNKTHLKCKAQEAIRYIEAMLSNKNERIMGLQSLLGNPKDKIGNNEKSGIYSTNCNDCGEKYIGQIRRSILTHFKEHMTHLRYGQTLNEVNEQKDVGKGQDNKIIACCFQVLEKQKKMILLTDDINLRNKAHINRIPVCSHKEIMTKIRLVLCYNSSKSKIILEKMTSLCKIVIQECASKAYGQACNKMPICKQVPQSLQDCINTFSKYWFPVFQEVLMKQFKKSIDDLSTFLSKNATIKDDSNQLNELLRLCVRCCIFLKDVESCKNTIENTIRDLNNIKES